MCGDGGRQCCVDTRADPRLGGRPRRERGAQGHRRRLTLASFPSHNSAMTPDLTEDDKAALVELLKETIATDRFPLSPRVRSFKAILAKLALPALAPELYPPPKSPGQPSTVLAKKWRR